MSERLPPTVRLAVREGGAGLIAAAAALLAMTGTAVAGLLLLNADRIGRLDRLVAGVVALAAGGRAEVSAAPAGGLPIAVQGRIEVIPLGVSVVGAVVLGVLLVRRDRNGLLVRGVTAVLTFAIGLTAVARTAHGTFTMTGLPAAGSGGAGRCMIGSGRSFGSLGGPAGSGSSLGSLGGRGTGGTIEAGFAVPVLPVAAGAMVWALAVVVVCWSVGRFPAVAAALRALRLPAAVIAVGCLLIGWLSGGRTSAGIVLLALPLVVGGVLLLGLGVPVTAYAHGPLSCVVDGGHGLGTGGGYTALAGLVLLAVGIGVARAGGSLPRAGERPGGSALLTGGAVRRAAGVAVRLAPVAGVALAVFAVLSRVSAQLGAHAFVFSVSILDARLAADPWPALAAGLLAGAVAGFTGSLLLDGFRRCVRLVGWRPWNDPARR